MQQGDALSSAVAPALHQLRALLRSVRTFWLMLYGSELGEVLARRGESAVCASRKVPTSHLL